MGVPPASVALSCHQVEGLLHLPDLQLPLSTQTAECVLISQKHLNRKVKVFLFKDNLRKGVHARTCTPFQCSCMCQVKAAERFC